jgi:integrase
VTLLEAREQREAAKKQLRAGIDPAAARARAIADAEAPSDTFKAVALEFVAKAKREGRADATLTKKEWLLDFAYPKLGALRVKDIRPIDVLGVLREPEGRGCYETARRLRATIGAVCRYAIATARAETDPTSALKGALTAPMVTPRAAITEAKRFGGLLRAIDGYDGQPTTHAALKLMALLFPRPGELRAAEWREFDLEEGIWTIPAARTKMRREHRVPLAAQVIAVLKGLQAVTGHRILVFPALGKPHRPMTASAPRKLRRASRLAIGRRGCFTGDGGRPDAAWTHQSGHFDDVLIVEPGRACDGSRDNATGCMFAEPGDGRLQRFMQRKCLRAVTGAEGLAMGAKRTLA